MLWVFLALGVCFWIVVGAARIIMGWVLPRETVAAIDRVTGIAVTTVLKLCVVGLAGLIIWFVYSASQSATSPPVSRDAALKEFIGPPVPAIDEVPNHDPSSPSCDEITAKIARATKAALHHPSSDGSTVFFIAAPADGFALHCRGPGTGYPNIEASLLIRLRHIATTS